MELGTIIKLILVVAGAGLFYWLWREGQLLRLTKYVQETREELRKCTWPGLEELKGSTVVVMISIGLLGAFTVGVDYVCYLVLGLIRSV